MPIYEYSCEKCGKTSDVLQKLDEAAPKVCGQCGARGKLKRVVSRTSFVLKGGGWGSDLYGTPKKESAATPSAGAPVPEAPKPAAPEAKATVPAPAAKGDK